MENEFNRAAHDKEIHTSPKHKFYGARMYRSAAVSHTNTGSFQAVNFDTEDYDTSPAGDFVDLSGDAFTIPVTGYYDIRFQVRFDANGTGRRRANINNGATILSGAEAAANATVHPSVMASWRGHLSKGDAITFEALQSSGGNLAYDVGTELVWAEIELVGV